jgi:uncharacterized protein (DUF305 family)
MKKLPLAVGTGVLALALGLTGCSTANAPTTTETSTSASTSTKANDDDAMFVTMMIPHHEQAIEMSDIVLAKSGLDTDVANLAQQIKAAQGPEVSRMKGWLTAWGVTETAPGMGGMDHGSMGDGMMSDGDMAALNAANGKDASRLFLTQMIAHHQGAVDMAQQEVRGGQNPDAVALAKSVIAAQTAEIAAMQKLLGRL